MARKNLTASKWRIIGRSEIMKDIQSDFLWGAATSAHQTEGGNDKSDWWAWEAEGNCEGGARSGRASDHWNRFSEDLKYAHDMGLNSYRFSVEWARVEPQEGKWDEEALGWYDRLLTECEKLGLVPMLTLHHFTSPKWFADKGGFTAKNSPELFARFVEKIAQTLGPRVPLWCTLNEPMVLSIGTYIGKFMPPAMYSPERASESCRNLLDCHVRAYDILHSVITKREGRWKDIPLQVGIAHNLLDFKPDRKWHPIERILTWVFRSFYNHAWLDAVNGRKQHFGVFGLVPKAKPLKEALNRKTVDFIGVNYYTKAYLRWRPKDASEGATADLPIGISFARRKEAISDLGWAVHPRGLGRILRSCKKYGVPLYVTENGIADREDRLRGEYLIGHLAEIAKVRAEGVDVRGYFHWSLIDNFEWVKGFGPRFGLVAIDYTDFKRTPRKSSAIFRKIIQAHTQDGHCLAPRSDLFVPLG
jgi:beta-glucosidase